VEIKGNQKPDKIVIVGAHYDSVVGSPGANDNGTGAAAVLALARAFAGEKTARTLRFVEFVNEEPPFFWWPELNGRFALWLTMRLINRHSLEVRLNDRSVSKFSALHRGCGDIAIA
jgi:hypothetical protein